MMEENDGANFTPEDFDLICRVCLQYEEDMVDIFESGIVDQITKLTNLKVNVNDKLPKTLCQNCSIQLDLLFKFQEKAKTSDTFLKSVLKAKKDSEPKPLPVESIKKKKKPSRPKKRKKHVFSKKKKKLQKKEPDDKIYLVLVPKVDETDSEEKSDILIKDINYATDNSDDKEISDLCKNFLKDNALDQTCQQPFNDDIETQNNVVESEPQLEKNDNEDELKNKGVEIQEGAGIQEVKQECPDEINEPEEVPPVEDVKPEETLPLENIKSEKIEELENVNPARIEPVYDPFGENRVLNINMVIFECGECNARFEEILDLKNHYIDLHGHEPLISPRSYKCPLCFYYGTGKDEFYAHLQNHKNEGFLFIKVNSEGDKIPVKENEGHVFADSNLKVKELCKIFKLNLEVFKCTVCNKELESKTLISDHVQKCSSKKKNTVKIYLKFTCPVCQISILNSENKFVDHLITHKAECVFYVKVDKTGKPVAVPNDDKLFIPLQEAEEIMKTLSKTSLVKISHVNNIYCCKTCNYVAQTYGLLSQHCSVVHGQLLLEPSIICPVCFEEFHKGNVDDRKNSLYQHLRVHRKKGIVFVEIKQDGSVSEFNEHYEDVFTYSSILCSLPNGFMSAGFPKVWSPEIIIYRRKSFSKYKCDMCKKRFKKKREISKHILSHQKHYICEKCGKSVTKLQYRSHILRHIESANKNKCTVCGKTFANKPSLHNHIRLHLEEGVEEEGESPQAGIICDECGKSFTNNSSLSKHKKKHATEKENALVKCEICGKEFIRQSSLVRHRAAHLDPKYFECEICKLPLPSTMTLRKHVELHKIRAANKTFDCDTCSISFLTRDSLRAHQSHTGHLIDRKPFECNVCKKKFDIGKKFAEHIKTHPKYKMGECTLCGKRLSTVQSLTMHMARHFGANGILCPHCGKQFFEDRNYRRHLLIHKGVKPHACEVEGCDKSFYTTFELNRHIKYHLNKRDFNCPYCSKSFHEANHLTVHVRTHTGERPYSCPHCDKSFVTRTRCKEHIKLIHQGIGYELIQSSISKKVTVFENEKKS